MPTPISDLLQTWVVTEVQHKTDECTIRISTAMSFFPQKNSVSFNTGEPASRTPSQNPASECGAVTAVLTECRYYANVFVKFSHAFPPCREGYCWVMMLCCYLLMRGSRQLWQVRHVYEVDLPPEFVVLFVATRRGNLCRANRQKNIYTGAHK